MNTRPIKALFRVTTVVLLAGCAQSGSTPPTPVSAADMPRLVAAADSLTRARRFQEASALYATALERWPDSLGIAKRALGSFWRSARFADAYIWGKRALASEPGSLSVRFNLGVTCGFLLALDCVDSVFSRALELDSSFIDGYGELAFLAQARGDMSAAVRYMETAYAIAPDNDFAVSGLAQMLIPHGQPRRARAVMEPRLAADRKARAYGGRSMLTLYGWALLREGDTTGANKLFEEVLGWLVQREREGQTSYQLYRERAAIYSLQGDRPAAIRAMHTAFDRGWRLYGAWSLPDPMFAGVADEPEVQLLVARMRDDVRIIRRGLGLEPNAPTDSRFQ